MLELKVANKGCIRRISARSLRAAKTRNLIAVLAIALTTLLFMSLFSIAGAIVNSFQESTFRQVGGRFHGTFKDVTQEQIDELSTDERIKSIALRQMLGMPTDPPFNKAHVEVSWMDENCARDYFIELEEGHYPREKDEIIVDSRVLALLGVEPEMGAKIELPYYLGQNSKHPELRTDTFTLCGWWEYDPACVASFANVSRAYADEVLGSYVPKDEYDITGRTDMNIMLGSSARIREEMLEILVDHGYQEDDEKVHGAASGEFIAIGVNWAYLGAQISENFDLTTVAAVVGLLLLIIFTGYLIIYNIFRISVSSDIQFYGLLKTIGTTGRQLKRIVRHQALALALGGIPIGLAHRNGHHQLQGLFGHCAAHRVPVCRSVFAGDGVDFLPQAGENRVEGIRNRGGALHRGRQRPGREENPPPLVGREHLPHGVGEHGAQPVQNRADGHFPGARGGADAADLCICERL